MSGKRKTSARTGRAPASAANPISAPSKKAARKTPTTMAPQPPLRKWTRRHTTVAAGLGILLLVAAVFGLRGTFSGGSEKLDTKSVDELQRLAVRRPNDANVLHHYGVALLKQGAANDASGVFQRLVQLDAANVKAQLNLGRSLRQLGDLGGAETAFKKAAELDPKGYEAHVGLMSLYRENGETQAAAGALEAALRSQPNDAAGWYSLGFFYSSLGQRERAVKALERSTVLSPDHVFGWRALGRVYWQMNRLEEAERVLQRALALQPKDPHTLLWLAQVYLQRPDTPANRKLAGEALQKATAAGPQPLPAAHFELARLYFRNGQPKLAEDSLRTVLRLAPNHEDAHLELGRLLTRRGDAEGKKLLTQYREMEARRRKLLALEARAAKKDASPETFLELARLYRGYGNSPLAMRAYRRYLSVRSQDQVVVDELVAYRKEVLPQLAPPAESAASAQGLEGLDGHDHTGHDHTGHGH